VDRQRRAAVRTFVVAGKNRDPDGHELACVGVRRLFSGRERHALDAEIAELRARDWQTERRAIANELDETLRGQHADPFADRILAAEPGLVLEGLGELQRGVEPAG